jgi:hypothetical protein
MPKTQPDTWYYFFKDFQTAIGTIVGFIGVCVTLWYNDRVANNRRLKDIDHDRATTRLALTSELSVIQRSLNAWKAVFDGIEREGKIGFARSFDAEVASRAYRAALPKIGLLTEREIQQVVLGYSEYESLSKMSHDVQDQLKREVSEQEKPLIFQAYLTALRNTSSAVNEAVDTLAEAHTIEKANVALKNRSPRSTKRS